MQKINELKHRCHVPPEWYHWTCDLCTSVYGAIRRYSSKLKLKKVCIPLPLVWIYLCHEWYTWWPRCTVLLTVLQLGVYLSIINTLLTKEDGDKCCKEDRRWALGFVNLFCMHCMIWSVYSDSFAIMEWISRCKSVISFKYLLVQVMLDFKWFWAELSSLAIV